MGRRRRGCLGTLLSMPPRRNLLYDSHFGARLRNWLRDLTRKPEARPRRLSKSQSPHVTGEPCLPFFSCNCITPSPLLKMITCQERERKRMHTYSVSTQAPIHSSRSSVRRPSPFFYSPSLGRADSELLRDLRPLAERRGRCNARRERHWHRRAARRRIAQVPEKDTGTLLEDPERRALAVKLEPDALARA